MSEFGINLVWASCLFVLIFLVNFLWVFKRGYENIKKQKKKKKNRKLEDFIGLSYLIPKFNLDINKMNYYGTGSNNESSSIANPRYAVIYQDS